MNQENLPKIEEAQYDPNLDAQDEEVMSGGNNRLLYILLAVLVVLVVGYIAMPKGSGSGLSSVTPSFMLDDAAVTASVPTSTDSIAAGLKKAPVAVVKEEEEKVVKTTEKPLPLVKSTGLANDAKVEAASVAPAIAPEPEPVVAAAPAPEPAAPVNTTVSGRIDDENGRPLVGATVLLKGSSKGTSTDASGHYSMEVPGGSDSNLIFGYGGYVDEVVHVSGSKPVNVTLVPSAKSARKRR